MADKRIQQYPEKNSPSDLDYLLLADSEDVDVNGFLNYKKVKVSDLTGTQSNGPTGSSVSYYLNGSVSQGTIGGVAYLEMNKTPILGAGTDFTRNTNGYIASFLTDAGDPNLLSIPAGNWNFETYFQASSTGGNPTFYMELYKYDGTTFTLIASNSGSPKLISDGTNIEAYFTALAVPQTTLTITDRLAIRIYVVPSGRTITLHTENNTLCQVITTFATSIFNSAITLGSLTTTQINALTPTNGMLVYNSTINQFCGYQNGAWVKFSYSSM